MNIAFFGSSLLSAYWNGAATYYRGLLRALHDLGHDITFYEPDAWERQSHRDIAPPSYAHSIVYPAGDPDAVLKIVEGATRTADLVVKASGVGVFDELLEQAVLDMRSQRAVAAFWDVDAAASLDRMQQNPQDPLRALIPRYDIVFTYGGGEPVVKAYRDLGAQRCVPVYNALDPTTHFPVAPNPQFEASLAFLGNRLPDREERVHEFFFKAAAAQPKLPLLLGGSGWNEVAGQFPNVRYLGHVYTDDHNAFNSTPDTVLNICRDSMARCGFSPPTRIFEAAGAGACLITDAWKGIEQFLDPGCECLVARSGQEVGAILREITPKRASSIGRAALRRVRHEHTYADRALEVERALSAIGL